MKHGIFEPPNEGNLWHANRPEYHAKLMLQGAYAGQLLLASGWPREDTVTDTALLCIEGYDAAGIVWRRNLATLRRCFYLALSHYRELIQAMDADAQLIRKACKAMDDAEIGDGLADALRSVSIGYELLQLGKQYHALAQLTLCTYDEMELMGSISWKIAGNENRQGSPQFWQLARAQTGGENGV